MLSSHPLKMGGGSFCYKLTCMKNCNCNAHMPPAPPVPPQAPVPNPWYPPPPPPWPVPPPHVYRNPPDVIVKPGNNVDVQTSFECGSVIYTVDAHVPEVVIENGSSSCLHGAGTSASPLGISEFQGTSGSADGKAGVVPAPEVADAGKFLKADGTWSDADNTRACTQEEMNNWLNQVDTEANSNG